MNDIIAAINKIRVALPKTGKLGYSEATTVARLIAPMLHVLGWDGFDSIEYEYRVKGGGMVDMALLVGNHPRIFVEAKAYSGLGGSTLSDKDAVQAVSYGATEGVEWCLLTNGIHYELYHTTVPLSLHDKVVFRADLLADDVAEAARRLRLLAMSACEDGTLDREGPRLLVETKLRAWLNAPDAELIEFVKSRFGNASIPDGAVRQALKSFATAMPSAAPPAPAQEPVKRVEPTPVPDDMRWGVMAITRPITVSGGYIRPRRIRETDGVIAQDVRIPQDDFPIVVRACCLLTSGNVELTSSSVRQAAFSDSTVSSNRQYWSSMQGLGVIWSLGGLDYVGGRGPQRFRLKDGMDERTILALLQKAVEADKDQ